MTALIFPDISPITELEITTKAPIPSASNLAVRTCPFSVLGVYPKRSRKSVMTTAVIELTPESILDMAAANIADTTQPEIPTGR